MLIGRLRRALEPELARAAESQVIRKAGGGYVLSTGPTDLDRYLDLAEAATAKRGNRPDEALALAAEALDVWTGRPWGDQADEAWLVDRVAAMEEGHRRIEELWADLTLSCGRSGDSIDRFRVATPRGAVARAALGSARDRVVSSGSSSGGIPRARPRPGVLRDELGLGLSEELAPPRAGDPAARPVAVAQHVAGRGRHPNVVRRSRRRPERVVESART